MTALAAVCILLLSTTFALENNGGVDGCPANYAVPTSAECEAYASSLSIPFDYVTYSSGPFAVSGGCSASKDTADANSWDMLTFYADGTYAKCGLQHQCLCKSSVVDGTAPQSTMSVD